MNTLSTSTQSELKIACEICFRPPGKTFLISGVKICAGCKSAYYRHNHKLLIFLLTHINDFESCKNQFQNVNNWSIFSDLIHRFLVENFSCVNYDTYTNSKNCTTIRNFKCKSCKQIKLMLKIRRFQGNMDNLGLDVQTLLNKNKESIFDDLVRRFSVPGHGTLTKSEKLDDTETSYSAFKNFGPAPKMTKLR